MTTVLLLGNGSDDNRGCEAIARGTLKIIEAASETPVRMSSGVIVNSPEAEKAFRAFPGSADKPAAFALRPVIDRSPVARATARLTGRRLRHRYPALAERLAEADLVLSVGGDNYSLDYGTPHPFVDLDDVVTAQGVPLAIWGASVGPFGAEPAFEREILDHFRGLAHLYVRETVSEAYLRDGGLSNVTLMADPAIMMPPETPAADVLGFNPAAAAGAVGLNLSPFQARHIFGSDRAFWQTTAEELSALADFGADLVRWLLRRDNRPVLLVPHVLAPVAWNNDHALLAQARERLDEDERRRVLLLPDTLTSPQIKGMIGRCSVFAGSRTHATLAALSSGVPTLAFGYSRKATGLMRDVYGREDMCIEPGPLTLERVTAQMTPLLKDDGLRHAVARAMEVWRERALAAGRSALGLARGGG